MTILHLVDGMRGLFWDYGVPWGIGLAMGAALAWALKPPRYIMPNKGVWDVSGWHPRVDD